VSIAGRERPEDDVPDVEIIGWERSTYTRVARMVCEEKAIRYDLRDVAPRSPQAFAIHPFGKIPVMRHGDFELCESKAIATYLDLSFPGPTLIPTEPREAALTEQWVSLVNTRIDTTMIRTYLFAYIFPKTADGKPDREAIDALTPTVEQEIGLLDRAVAKTGFLVGDSLTYADINLMPILFLVRQLPEGAAAMAAAKPLSDYYQRIAARPSFQNTMPPPGPPPRLR
jgi:glutathione S-transferase